MRTVGEKITHPATGESFVFAGYDEAGHETWCDVGLHPDGRPGLSAPETKTFKRFTERGSEWSQALDAFVAAVEGECGRH